ncbi:DUF4180 domain-containing protein [Flavivirga aquimarina]|uniref:DUF4180 domain-containing protein n=1 Tax=Flavivirga aquimarina TaxID=2027862 RepID=A0ABT8WAT9_9FLAO|nr:DUF4180 domain-containing protein [Flavivirga aquimarina]MDO5970266.1 DUF4180 domain-containing protein [Flavivirga aquimarina]
MNIEIIENEGVQIAKLSSDQVEIRNAQDAIEILMNCLYKGAENIIVAKENLTPDFFELKTKVAGEILQKFSTYDSKIAIVGDFNNIKSKSLKDFIFESNKLGQVNFVGSVEEGIEKLTSKS